jgi:hypothetical protein
VNHKSKAHKWEQGEVDNAICTDLPNKRMSFAIFIREVATVLSAPLVSTKVSCAAWKKRHCFSMQKYFL